MAKLKRKAFKPVMRYILMFMIIINVIVSFWTIWSLTIRYRDQMYTQDSLSDIPEHRVAIVYGAGIWPDGRVSLILQDRLDAAIELYHAGKVEKLLFSGDNRFVDYNEPAGMLDYALNQGIPRQDIVLDFAGRRTYDTCYRARDIFEVPDAIVVTQRFHMPRALLTCNALGLDSDGYVADRHRYVRRYLTWYWVREIPALWLGWIDVNVRHPVPVLGDPLPIFNDIE